MGMKYPEEVKVIIDKDVKKNDKRIIYCCIWYDY